MITLMNAQAASHAGSAVRAHFAAYSVTAGDRLGTLS